MEAIQCTPLLYKSRLYSFLIILSVVLEFLNFLASLVLVSYKAVSYKNVYSIA